MTQITHDQPSPANSDKVLESGPCHHVDGEDQCGSWSAMTAAETPPGKPQAIGWDNLCKQEV